MVQFLAMKKKAAASDSKESQADKTEAKSQQTSSGHGDVMSEKVSGDGSCLRKRYRRDCNNVFLDSHRWR